MAIEVSCRCGRRFAAKPELAGQRVSCPACGAGLVIPRPAAAPVVVACACGKRFEAQPHLAGRQVPCPSCRRPLLIPAAGGAAAPVQSGFDFDLAAYEASAPAAPRAAGSINPHRWADAAPLAKARVAPRKSSSINPRVFVIGGVVAGGALVLVLGIVLAVQAVRGVIRGVTTRLVGEELPLQQEDYAQFRQTFRTQLVRRGPSPQDGEPLGVYQGVDRIAYRSGGLNLTAYVDRAPADGRPRPAVLYLHGGFAFGEEDLEQAQPYRDAGFIVMVPVLRGENGQPGDFTLSYDEVDDVLGAAEALAALPYVDAQQICVAGHSAGGTLAMLAALASPRFRASANFSGTANEKMVCDEMPELVVYNQSDPREMLARSAEAFATSFKCPARLYYGNREWYFKPQLDRTAQRAQGEGHRRPGGAGFRRSLHHARSRDPAEHPVLPVPNPNRAANDARLAAGGRAAARPAVGDYPDAAPRDAGRSVRSASTADLASWLPVTSAVAGRSAASAERPASSAVGGHAPRHRATAAGRVCDARLPRRRRSHGRGPPSPDRHPVGGCQPIARRSSGRADPDRRPRQLRKHQGGQDRPRTSGLPNRRRDLPTELKTGQSRAEHDPTRNV
jgi:dienelactone hydrolase